MKQKISKVVAAMLLTASLPVTAEMCSNFNPYVGADAQYRYMPFENNFGANLFKKTSPQANFFVGNRFNEYFGFELGYSTSKKVKRDVRIVTGERVAGGNPIPANAFLGIHSTSKISGFSANLLGFLPVQSIEGLDIMGSVGIARTKAKLFYNVLSNTGNPLPAGTVTTRTFSARKTLMRIGGGVQYEVLCNLSVRALVNWENTNRFHNVVAKESATSILRSKNSIIYSLGLQYRF